MPLPRTMLVREVGTHLLHSVGRLFYEARPAGLAGRGGTPAFPGTKVPSGAGAPSPARRTPNSLAFP